jgi:hypothetical protein
METWQKRPSRGFLPCRLKVVILTDVPHVSTGFGTKSEKPLNCMDVATSL